MKWVISTFFSKEYLNYDSSNIEFRKSVLKIIQICLNIFLIIFMLSTFPFQDYPREYFISMPILLIGSNLITFFFLRIKIIGQFITIYICILQLVISTIGLELSMELVQTLNKEEIIIAAFIGIQAGLIYSISFMRLSPPFYKFFMSIILMAHILIKQYKMGNKNILGTSFVIGSIFIIVDYVYYRKEILSLNTWKALMRKNEGLKHFENLVQIFPSQILVLDSESLETNTSLYFNLDAQKLRQELMHVDNTSLSEFLEIFEVVEVPIESSLQLVSRRKSLKSLILEAFSKRENFQKDFQTYMSSIKIDEQDDREKKNDLELAPRSKNEDKIEKSAYKWEIKIGSIQWNQKEALIIIFNDISKAEKIRELKLLDQNKDKLLATVSHELRTPLNGIVGMIDVSCEELFESPEKVKTYLECAKNSAKYLLFMINDILDLSQIRNGSLRLSLEWTELRQVLEKVMPLIKIQVNMKNLEFIYENRCPERTFVLADPTRLQQILMNLLGNACKFTSNGYVKLSTFIIKQKILKNNGNEQPSALRKGSSTLNFDVCNDENSNLIIAREESVDFVELTVEDTGKGIKDDQKQNLFKLFGKIETEGNNTGVGLGLAISQSLAKKMHSTGIKVESTYGKGSLFCFRLKANFGEYTTTQEINIPEELPNSHAINETVFKKEENELNISYNKNPSLRLLVVDDDKVNHLVISLYLKGLSHNVISDRAYNGEEALKFVEKNALKKQYYDIILMDCDMPVMNGLQASAKLRDWISVGKIPGVKIVALTANASLFDKECCYKNGMMDVWTKPISRRDFIEKFTKLMC